MGRQWYGRPLFIAMSADLSESTNIAGFADGFVHQVPFVHDHDAGLALLDDSIRYFFVLLGYARLRIEN